MFLLTLPKKSSRKYLRPFFSAFLFLSVFFLSWKIVAALAVFMIFFFQKFGEGLAVAFFLDSLSGLPFGIFISSLALLLVVSEEIKKYLHVG